MTRWLLPLIFCLTWVTPSVAAPDPEERLSSGEVLTDVRPSSQIKGGIDVAGVALVDAPLDRVWQALTSCDAQLSFVPGLRECTVVEGSREKQGWDVTAQTFQYAFPFPTIRTRVHSAYYDGSRIEMSGAGGDIAALNGRWILSAHPDGRTQVNYDASFKSRLAVPRSLIQRSTRKDLPRLFERLRDLVERPVSNSG